MQLVPAPIRALFPARGGGDALERRALASLSDASELRGATYADPGGIAIEVDAGIYAEARRNSIVNGKEVVAVYQAPTRTKSGEGAGLVARPVVLGPRLDSRTSLELALNEAKRLSASAMTAGQLEHAPTLGVVQTSATGSYGIHQLFIEAANGRRMPFPLDAVVTLPTRRGAAQDVAAGASLVRAAGELQGVASALGRGSFRPDELGNPASDFVSIHPGVIKEIQARLTREVAEASQALGATPPPAPIAALPPSTTATPGEVMIGIERRTEPVRT